MANEHRYSSLQLVELRVALLDNNGSPDDGTGGGILSNGYVTDSAITLGVDEEISVGTDLEQKNGSGGICGSYKEGDVVKRVNFTMDLCQLDYALIALLTGSDLFSSAGQPIGFQIPASTTKLARRLSFEFWTKAYDGGAPATNTYSSGAALYHHFVSASTQWTLGGQTFDDGFHVVSLTGQGFENPRITTNGPFDDWPAAIRNAGGVTRALGSFYDTALPAVPENGYVNVTSTAS